MATMMYCPFLTVDYKDKTGKLCIRCERALIKFESGAEWRDFVSRYCGSENGWKACSIAKNTMKHYEKE